MKPKLIVLLHGYNSSPKRLKKLETFIKFLFPTSTIIKPHLPLSIFSTIELDEIVEFINGSISSIWNTNINKEYPFEKIILIGHSIGGILARKILLLADKRSKIKTDEFYQFDWYNKIERTILLAGMNKGWSIDSHLSLPQVFFWRLGILLGSIFQLVTRKKLLIFKVRRGSEFITDLRIDWITNFSNRTPVIQLLGTIDDIVSPNDNVDDAAGKNFIYMDIPSTGHANVLDLDDPKYGTARKKIIREAVLNPIEDLRKNYDSSNNISNLINDESITDVVFVIHGIRDKGFWTQKLARKVIKKGIEHGRLYKSETSSYGYFAMLPFVLPWRRKEKVKWLMDQYCENRAMYPKADFSFIGHSNGTHLLADALLNYPKVVFANVVFIGSVVHQDFNWAKIIERKQIKKVRNFYASNDLVVAAFPFGFSKWGSKELGGAGHIGFNIQNSIVDNIGKVKGGHSGALQESYWDSIASFIVTGGENTIEIDLVKNHTLVAKIISAISLFSLIFIVIVLIILFSILWVSTKEWHDIARILAILVYLNLVWQALNRL